MKGNNFCVSQDQSFAFASLSGVEEGNIRLVIRSLSNLLASADLVDLNSSARTCKQPNLGQDFGQYSPENLQRVIIKRFAMSCGFFVVNLSAEVPRMESESRFSPTSQFGSL